MFFVTIQTATTPTARTPSLHPKEKPTFRFALCLIGSKLMVNVQYLVEKGMMFAGLKGISRVSVILGIVFFQLHTMCYTNTRIVAASLN